jgi:hypothetical protein
MAIQGHVGGILWLPLNIGMEIMPTCRCNFPPTIRGVGMIYRPFSRSKIDGCNVLSKHTTDFFQVFYELQVNPKP